MINDPYFRVEVLSKTERPNLLSYLAMHQDYSEKNVADEMDKLSQLSERELGERLIKRCIKYSHWGVIEHPSITFNCIGFPHNVMVQARTHRVAVSFDCLASESMITVKQGRTVKTKSIAELYQMQQNGEVLPLIRSLNENRGYFEYSPIKEVFRNSPKNLYLVTLADGKQLKCSLDHRIFSDKGWARLADLEVGDKVACNGLNITSTNYGVRKSVQKARSYYTNPLWLANELQTKTPKQIGQELGCSYEVIKKYAYNFGLSWEIKKNHNKGKKLNLSHLTDEQKQHRQQTAVNNLKKAHDKTQKEGHPSRKLDDFDERRIYNWQHYKREEILNQLGRKCNNCEKEHDLHCHHKISLKDNVHLGYELNNYEILCASCHAKEHKSLRPHFVKIIGIEFLRNDITYDIEVDGKFHNFVCEGIVVHNCQSQRYTGDRISKLAHIIRRKSIGDKLDASCREAIESVFYVRPQGTYQDRNGNNYEYTTNDWKDDINTIIKSTLDYDDRICKGWSPEHARDLLIQNIRQDFVVTFNARSLLHFCDLRLPADAQLEIRTLAQMLFDKFSEWMPECAEWYEKNRKNKSKLAP